MTKVTKVTLDIEELVERLPINDKIKLVRKLEKATWAARWDQLLAKIDERVKKNPITDEEIEQVVREVRKERYERKKAKGSN